MTFTVLRNGRPLLDAPKRPPMVKHHCCNCPATFMTYAGREPTHNKGWLKVNGKLYCQSPQCRKAASEAREALRASKPASSTPSVKPQAITTPPVESVRSTAKGTPERPAPVGKPRPLYAERLLHQQGLGS